MISLKKNILMSAAFVGLLSTSGVATVANAQESYTPPQGQQQQQMNITDAQLEEFAKAQAAVSQVQRKLQGQAANITSQEEMTALQQQANEQMVQAVQQTDLNVQEYNLIASAVQADPQVQARYKELVE